MVQMDRCTPNNSVADCELEPRNRLPERLTQIALHSKVDGLGAVSNASGTRCHYA